MEIFYSDAKASAVLKATSKKVIVVKGTGKKLRQLTMEVSLQTSGGAFKSTTRIVDSDSSEKVYCRNPERYVFSLEKAPDKSGYKVNNILPKTSAFSEQEDVFATRLIHVSHGLFGIPLS